jgi:hypothetical protein
MSTWVCTECGAIGVIGTPHYSTLTSKSLCHSKEWVPLLEWVTIQTRQVLRDEFTGTRRCCERDTDGDGNCPRHPVKV